MVLHTSKYWPIVSVVIKYFNHHQPITPTKFNICLSYSCDNPQQNMVYSIFYETIIILCTGIANIKLVNSSDLN